MDNGLRHSLNRNTANFVSLIPYILGYIAISGFLWYIDWKIICGIFAVIGALILGLMFFTVITELVTDIWDEFWNFMSWIFNCLFSLKIKPFKSYALKASEDVREKFPNWTQEEWKSYYYSSPGTAEAVRIMTNDKKSRENPDGIINGKSDIQFKVRNIYFESSDDTILVLEGDFTNIGEGVGKVKQINLSIVCYDYNKNVCAEAIVSFFDLNFLVSVGAVISKSFRIQPKSYTEYRGNLKWNVNCEIVKM